jgi:8-oxo-dGTP diphosphatase
MDSDELPEEALIREVAEETGINVRPKALHSVASLAGWAERRGILLVYRAEPVDGTLMARDDVSDVRWFRPSEVPWDELAFDSTTRLVRDWLASLG